MRQLLPLFLFFLATGTFAQNDGEPLNSINYRTAERLEIKSGSLKNDLHFTMRPISRQALTDFALKLDTASNTYLTDIDYYNVEHIYLDNNDLVPPRFFTDSPTPIFRHFYKTPAHLFDLHTDAVDLTIDPIFYGNISYDSDIDGNIGYINTRGAEVRATIDDKVTLYTSLTENQVEYPTFVKRKIDSLNSIPTKGFFQRYNDTGYDYFEPKGGLSVDATEHINLQFGYDQHVVGDGYRSLFLSDNANNSLFLKFNTRFWKVNYTNLYQELLHDGRFGPDTLKTKKYMVSHHLSFDVADWLNIGLFESIIFARENQFEFHYLNPLIFYRAIEQQVGSPDNAMIGLNYSALVKDRLKLYGQLVIDEFRIDDIRGGEKSWANKFAFQQGAKYIDAFGVEQLDLQAEVNRTRPYTYMHNKIETNYTHYGSALAHPLAANFTEVVALAHYQPFKKLRLNGIVTYADYGTDPTEQSWGADIYNKTYRNRPFSNGVVTGQGIAHQSLNLQARTSYELKHNLFLELQGVHKMHGIEGAPDLYETYLGGSVRWNFGAYDYNY